MTTCPSCGIAGDNLGCPNHIYWGINPLPDSIPMPEQSAWASLYAEIGRLNVLLNERNKEIERLKSLMPPDERGPGFVGQGSWSVFAEKVVAERDALRGEVRFLKDVVLTGIQEDLRIARQERDELKECLRWYVENDDTNEGGKWEESNAPWLEGKRRAMRALGMEEE